MRAGGLDGAAAAVEPVLSLSLGMRLDTLPVRFRGVRAELAGARYQGSRRARELDERIEEFCREGVVADLRALPGGPG